MKNGQRQSNNKIQISQYRCSNTHDRVYNHFLLVVHRWGNTPMDEAMHFGHHDVVVLLQENSDRYSPPTEASDKDRDEKSLDSLL